MPAPAGRRAPSEDAGLTRRAALVLGGAAAASAITPIASAFGAPFSQPPLGYGLDALAPHISARTMQLHAVDLLGSYYQRLNMVTDGTPYAALAVADVVDIARFEGDDPVFTAAAQVFNHEAYFAQFAGGYAPPGPALEESLGREFGGLEGLAEQLFETASTVTGSGWVWLTAEGDALYLDAVQGVENPAGSSRIIIMAVDLWEHAYIIDHGTRRNDYLSAIVLNLMNWGAAETRFLGQ
ncbi:MAG: Fe-Mn family superoxide dismutase [Pseudomonadota bacterium]